MTTESNQSHVNKKFGPDTGSSSLRRRKLIDKAAGGVVWLGGVGVIICIVTLFFFIGIETIPLWRGAKANLVNTIKLHSTGKAAKPTGNVEAGSGKPQFKSQLTSQLSGDSILAVGVDDYKSIAYTLTSGGVVSFISLEDGILLKTVTLSNLDGATVTSVANYLGLNYLGLGTDEGFVLPVKIEYEISYDKDGKRVLKPVVIEGSPIAISQGPIKSLSYIANEEDGESAAAVITESGRVFLYTATVEQSLFGEGEVESSKVELTASLGGAIPVKIAHDPYFANLYIGAEDGKLFHYDIRGSEPEVVNIFDATGSRAVSITTLGFLLGGSSLVVGDASGGISIWFQVLDKHSPIGRTLKKAHVLPPQKGAVAQVAPSLRNRGLIAGDALGNVTLYYTTSERKLLEIEGDGRPLRALAFTPRADGIVAVGGNGGEILNWNVYNPHPEINLKTLFGKVWYEGLDKPEWVWQSTGGTDEYEPKFSLTPLVYGTIKGTIYALLLAIPIAVLSAMCVSQFMHPSYRNLIKPIIETMAALPSVVLGFLAGLWLAPLIEEYVPGVLLWFFITPPMVLLSVLIWRFFPEKFRLKFKDGSELFFLIPVVLLSVALCYGLNSPIDATFFGGDYREWLLEILGLKYDQRNAMVVGIAMGFAVIPIIFTISEDAFSNVPKNLISASLALGANRWQTAINVVLPTASPGIFSSIMIGFGRAVGETMIVLMATGNTPIMDLNIFNGFRALSANIAVEIPEAPQGDTLYRVLFLAALLLFVMTFVINTAGEIVRTRLRKKYGNL